MKQATHVAGLILGLAVATAAQAQLQAGDILFTGQNSNALSSLRGGVVTDLWVNPNSAARMATIVQGPGNDFYVSDGRFPGSTESGILKFEGLGSAVSVSMFATGDPFMNPVGMAYDGATSTFLSVNNPAGGGTQGVNEGIIATSLDLPSSSTLVYQEPDPSTPLPRYNAGNRIIAAPMGGGFLISTLNGGSADPNPPGSDSEASGIYRMHNSGGAWVMSEGPVVDFSASVTGLGVDYTNIRGMASVSGSTSVYVTDHVAGALLRVDFDAAGNYAGMAQILDGLNQPESIVFNELTSQLVIAERGQLTDARISSVNLDGSGYEILYEGDHARGLYVVIPAPGVLAVLALPMLTGRRRRR